jgi:hypothetical protein
MTGAAVFTSAPETGECFFTIEGFHAPALEVVRGTASFGGQLLQSGFGFWPEVYLHKASLERRAGCVKSH